MLVEGSDLTFIGYITPAEFIDEKVVDLMLVFACVKVGCIL